MNPDSYADSIVQAYRRRSSDVAFAQIPESLPNRPSALGYVRSAENTERSLEGLISAIYEESVASLRPEFQRLCADRVRARCLPSNDVDGYISQSDDGSYAIIISMGFMTFLHKISKIDLAINDPSLVAYCNRCAEGIPNRDMLEVFKDEIVQNFKRGDSRGPILYFKEDVIATIGFGVSTNVHLQEKFIVCHEIGHLISDFFLHGLVPSMLHTSYGSNEHRSEYAADLLGFAILRQRSVLARLLGGGTVQSVLESRALQKADDQCRLSAICQFFEVLALASPKATESHPSPHDRACNIIATYYGNKFAGHYDAYLSGKVTSLDWESCWREGKAPATTAARYEVLALGTGLS